MKRILYSLLVATLPFGSVLADAPKSKNANVTLVYEDDVFPLRHQFVQQPKTLGLHVGGLKIYPGGVAAGPIVARHQTRRFRAGGGNPARTWQKFRPLLEVARGGLNALQRRTKGSFSSL